LTPRGLVVNQCGVPFMQAEELRETSARRRRFFPYVSAYVAAVPTYVGGLMALGIASKDADFASPSVETIRDRAAAQGILGTTGYWSPEVQAASFALPPYIARCLTP
jgi:spermidine synthase